MTDLRETIRIHRDIPPIIMANIGTTMKEGIDDIPKIRSMFREMAIPRSYIHCDAALDGMILPFIEGAPQWDFAAGIDSLAISGHKFIGSPIPCGIALAKKSNVDRIARSIEYVGTLDTTVTGSRNGITPIFLWYAIQRYGREGFAESARRCLDWPNTPSTASGAWRGCLEEPVCRDGGVSAAPGERPAAVADRREGRLRPHHLHVPFHRCVDRYADRRHCHGPATGGHPMKQITIVTPGRAGLMADISDHLGKAGINIETLEAFVVRDWDIVQLTVSDYNRACVVLRDAGFRRHHGRCRGD